MLENDFVKRSNEVHNNKYDYSKIEYSNTTTKIKIVCPEHGEFEQKPSDHLNGHGCLFCGRNIAGNKTRLSNDKFIKMAKKIHGNKYDYSLVEYKNYLTKVAIVCKYHGVFKQNPGNHLKGQNCPGCKSSKGEEKVKKWLLEKNIVFKEQYSFEDCVYKQKLKFDFYLPETNTVIEYDGLFHFKETSIGNNLNESLVKDKIKDDYCIKNNIRLIRIGFWENIKEVLE